MQLIEPSSEYKDSFIAAIQEYQADTENRARLQKWMTLSPEALQKDFEWFVDRERSHARGENLPVGWVPDTQYWLVDRGEYIGQANIRHYLNERLLLLGGHIGYDIRPSKRRQGYGTKILELALPKAKALGIDPVLVTCDANNDGSRRIIEKNGGVLENQVANPDGGPDKLRYWISLG